MKEPTARETGAFAPLLEGILAGRARDADGFPVRRVLPWGRRRHVGPFVFFDHMGPADIPPGQGVDVRPHPHIGLATLTYLFEGEIVHRDILGSVQVIRPGDVNWMEAGSGIVHSERTSPKGRRTGGRVHGIQSWLALALDREEDPPRFTHHPGASISEIARPGARLKLIAGSAYDKTSPVAAHSPTLYVDAQLDAGSALPIPDGYEERAVYVVDGTLRLRTETGETPPLPVGSMAILRALTMTLRADTACRVMLLGGDRPVPERQIWWNFVSSSSARIQRAEKDWAEGRYPKVPGDEIEFVPLPR